MGALIGQIVTIAVDVIDLAIRQGKDFKEALADGFDEAARKIRSGELNVDAAVEQAKADQAKLDNLRSRFRD